MIIWGSGGDVLDLGEVDTQECPACEKERPFHVLLEYRYWGLYWIFSFVTEKKYSMRCTTCGSGVELESNKIENTCNGKLLIVRILILMSTVILGCGEEKRPELQLPAFGYGTGTGKADRVAIYYDATQSMAGFVADDGYVRLVGQEVENAAPATLPIGFFKAGSKIKGLIQPIQRPVLAREVDFYANGDTRLDALIDSAQSENLTVIVTDLFQTDSDINRVSKAIENKLSYRDDIALGVAGFLFASFHGKVYDVGLTKEWYPWKGARPAYLLAIGPHDSVESYFVKLEKLVNPNQRKKWLILASGHLSEPLRFQSTKKTVNLVETSRLVSPKPEGYDRSRIKQFIIRDNRESATFEIGIKGGGSRPYISRPVDGGLRVSIAPNQTQFYPQKGESWQSRPDEAKAVTVALRTVKWDDDSTTTVISMEIDPKELERGLSKFVLEIEPDESDLPSWVDDWNMDMGRIKKWKENRNSFEGDKTQHLKPFVQRLKDTLYEVRTPKLGSLVVVIKKER